MICAEYKLLKEYDTETKEIRIIQLNITDE